MTPSQADFGDGWIGFSASAKGGAIEWTAGGEMLRFNWPSLADPAAGRDGPRLAAPCHSRQWALTAPYLLVAFLALPLVTLKVVGASTTRRRGSG
jgi:hypothetical protein